MTITDAAIILPQGTSYSTVPLIRAIPTVIVLSLFVAVKVRAKRN